MIIDAEHHLFLPEMTSPGRGSAGRVVERYRGQDGGVKRRLFEAAANPEEHLRFMDEAGIDCAVLSTNPELDLDHCRKWNDFCARTVALHPKRFSGLASIPPLGGGPALQELERAAKDLGLRGVHIHSRSGARTLDDPAYLPFFEKAAELRLPIDVHIVTAPQGFDALQASYPLYYIMAREFDMCATVLRLCLGGVLERFPDLAIIINHFGGGISAVLERVDAYMSYAGPGWPDFYPGQPPISRPWREYFDKLYFNMAGRERGMAAVRCALTNISPKKLLFGTDWPFNYDGGPQGVRDYVSDIRTLDLPEADVAGMLGGNAARLLGLRTS